MAKKSFIWIGIGIILIIIGGTFLLASPHLPPALHPSPGVLQVVATENFWGSLVSQIGGTRIQVRSIVSDPNADPHEYESGATDARAVADADYVIVNGAGYDSWMDKLIGAGGTSDRKVLTVADILGKKTGDNPHFWYDPAYVNRVVAQMTEDLISLDPIGAPYYQERAAALDTSLATYQNRIAAIAARYRGTEVGATEDMFAYLADAAGLTLSTPPEFLRAVGEGNDPPAASVVTFQSQIKEHQVKIVVYNVQTITPVTESIRNLAVAENIPVLGISETIEPPGTSFQNWMDMEVAALAKALEIGTGK